MEKELTLDEIHKYTLDLLKVIIDICEKNQIKYFLAFGSLIGAVRHKGFIPWDDDCDLIMLREDYNRFLKYCIEHEQELRPYKLLSRDTTKDYPYNINRFNDMRFRAEYYNVQSYDSGLFIDIYPYDAAGSVEDSKIEKIRKFKNKYFKVILWCIDKNYQPSTSGKWYRSFIKYIVRSYAKLKGSAYWLDKFESLKDIYDMNTSKYVSEMTWDAGLILCKKDWFSDTVKLEFDGIEVSVPVGYKEFLHAYYGDYMKLPPKSERKPQHEYKLYWRK